MHQAHEVARKHLKRAARRQKDLYDAKLNVNQYAVGDLVWYLAETRRKGEAQKLEKDVQGSMSGDEGDELPQLRHPIGRQSNRQVGSSK